MGGIQVTLGLPPAGIFWQPAGGLSVAQLTPLPTPLLCSPLLLGAPRRFQPGRTAPSAAAAPPHFAPPGPLSPVPVGAAEPRHQILPLSCAHAARIPRSAVATPAERPGCSLGPFFPGLARVRLVRKLQHGKKAAPSFSSSTPGKKRLPSRF